MESSTKIAQEATEKDPDEQGKILTNECEEMWNKLFEIYSKIQCRKDSCPSKGIENNIDNAQVHKIILQAKEKKLQAELEAIKSEEIIVSSKELQPNEDLIKKKLAERENQLEETLLVAKNQTQDTKLKLEREEEIYKQHQEIQKSIQKKITDLEKEKENQHGLNSKVKELERKREGVEKSLSELMKKLGTFINEHFPVATEKHPTKQPKDHAVKIYISLQQLLEELIKKLYDSPHDPYIEIQPSYWPPYIELLLRCGIAQRHPEDCNLIRLESFQA